MSITRRHFIAALAVVLMMIGTAAFAEEMRGAWVSAWSAGFYTPQQVDATVAAAKKAGLTTLFIQVRKNGDAYYNSSTEPLGNGIAPGFDPLAYAVEKAHAAGLKVHAWVNSVRLWTAKEPPTDPRHIVNRHPEWLNKRDDGSNRATEGLYLDPGIPEVRKYIVGITEEIARKYSVDGIHLDYIRYPGDDWGYSDLALAQFASDTGQVGAPVPRDARWMQWKRDQITQLVGAIRSRVKAIKPKLQLTAATIPWGDCPVDFAKSAPYSQVCQDWKSWMTSGLLDANVPMNYKVESSAGGSRQFRNWLKGFSRWSGGKPVYVGIDVYNNQVADVVKQIQAVRSAKLGGFVLFSFNESAKRKALVDQLAKLRR